MRGTDTVSVVRSQLVNVKMCLDDLLLVAAAGRHGASSLSGEPNDAARGSIVSPAELMQRVEHAARQRNQSSCSVALRLVRRHSTARAAH
jgi:hypothetical protein